MRIFLTAAAALLGLGVPATAADAKIPIVAAENFYGEIASEIGGDRVSVTSVLNNPDEDPHLFEASPSVARALADARLVIYNGADYDPWVEKMLFANETAGRSAIVAAELVGSKPGDNPHLWYDPPTAPAVARAVAAKLEELDPAHRADYEARLAKLDDSLKAVGDRVAALRAKYAGVAVTATEPVFGYMAAALGLTMRNQRFQTSVMNDTEPSARDTLAFEQDLRRHEVKVMFYNSQVTDPQTDRLLKLANAGNVAVVGVTETMPAGKTFAGWMLGELDATEKALAGPSS